MTTKNLWVIGSKATIVADFEVETLTIHKVRHELIDDTWTAVRDGAETPVLGTASPVDQVVLELESFLESVKLRNTPAAGVVSSGVHLGKIMDAVYKSSREQRSVSLNL